MSENTNSTENTETELPDVDATLVQLKISNFNNRREDKAISKEVRDRKKIDRDAGSWRKSLLPSGSLKPVTTMASRIRRYTENVTLHWDTGLRFLPEAMRETYVLKYNELIDEHAARLNDFMDVYESLIDCGRPHAEIAATGNTNMKCCARGMHGDSFDNSEYPDAATMRASFTVGVSFLPLPQSSHFTATLRSIYGDAIDEQLRDRVKSASDELLARLLEPVQKMAEVLSDPDAIVRETLVGNVLEICQTGASLNATNDAQLNELMTAMQDQLSQVDKKGLKQDKVLRASVAEKAKGILAQFGKVGAGRKFAEIRDAVERTQEEKDAESHDMETAENDELTAAERDREIQADMEAGYANVNGDPIDVQ